MKVKFSKVFINHNKETKQLDNYERLILVKLFAMLLIGAIGLVGLSFIYNHRKIRTKLENEKNNKEESNNNTQYELLNAVSEGPLITDV